MIFRMFAVVDRISGVWDGPHKAINEGQFLRDFGEAAKQGHIANHPEDFYVAYLGTFNDATGEIVGLEEGPTRIAEASDFVRTVPVRQADSVDDAHGIVADDVVKWKEN